MNTVNHYFNLAIDFLLFTFNAKIMILSAISTVVLSIINRFVFSSRWQRSHTNLFGFPTAVADDHSAFEFVFEWMFIICIYVAVYAGCLIGWSYFAQMRPDLSLGS